MRSRPCFALLVCLLASCSSDPSPSYRYIPPPDAAVDGPSGSDASVDVEAGEGDGEADVGQVAPTLPSELHLWAPNATAVVCVGSFGGSDHSLPMTEGGDGMWRVELPGVAQGDPYHFRITTSEGEFDRLDPRALARDDSGARSLIWPSPYPSADTGFQRPGVRDAVIYEMHAGTYHDEPGGWPGSLYDAVERLDHLASLGVNVIELMPIHDFPGEHSWGYNPVLPYVVDSVYGGPDALAAFVQAAHGRGIAVVLDVVYNHLAVPNPLCAFDGGDVAGCGGIYFYEQEYPDTPWGPRFDYDRPQVRSYLQDNARMWVDTFRVDGFRWDSTGNIRATDHGHGDPIPAGEVFLKQANEALHASSPGLLSIAEDLSGNASLTRPVGEGGYGFDAQWDAGFHATIVAQLEVAGSGDPNMGAIREALLQAASAPFEHVLYTESHDSTGKLNGHVRLPDQVAPEEPEGSRAKRLAASALALTLTAPGIPMLLQGQEFFSQGSFHDDAPLDWSRATAHSGFLELATDLVRLRRNLDGTTAGLRGNGIAVHHVNDSEEILAFHRFDAGGASDDVVVVVSLSPGSYPTYRLGVPALGQWRARVDSSWEAYGLVEPTGVSGPGNYVAEPEPLDGLPANILVSLGPYGILVLSQDG